MAHFAEHPDEAALFNEAMVDKAAGVVPAVVQAYDFSPFATIVDVGGGRGHLLSAILERAARRPASCSSCLTSSPTPLMRPPTGSSSSPATSSPIRCPRPTPTS